MPFARALWRRPVTLVEWRGVLAPACSRCGVTEIEISRKNRGLLGVYRMALNRSVVSVLVCQYQSVDADLRAPTDAGFSSRPTGVYVPESSGVWFRREVYATKPQ